MKKTFTHNPSRSIFSIGCKAILLFSLALLFGMNVQANDLSDKDADGINDDVDNCVDTYNPSQADYDQDGIGDVCDYANYCDSEITSIRRVQNLATSCSGNEERVLWISGALSEELGDLYFVELANNTAKLNGQVKDLNTGEIRVIDVTFSGKTTAGTPYYGCASQAQSADWYYYSDFSGTIGDNSVTPNPDHNFQIGFGANVKNDLYGASGWMTLDGTAADFNFDLGAPLISSDKDADGICDNVDNCVDTYNPSQADYDKDGIGDVCDQIHDCDKISSIRRVQNLATACSGSDDRVIWIEGAYCREIGNLYFTEYENGTAKLEGQVQEVDGSNISEVDVYFTGKTEAWTPYTECASTSESASWYYYDNYTGTIGGHEITERPEHKFQVGFGASVKNDAYGASGWFRINNQNADFNFDLSEPLTCGTEETTCNNVLAYYDLDACLAYADYGSFAEFTAAYPSDSGCSNVKATNVYRDNASDYGHSCIAGQSGNALCITGTHVDYLPTASVHRLKFSVTLQANTTVSGLSFYQKSESTILNNGQTETIDNNYLRKYAVRAKIDGDIVFESINNKTSQAGWSLASFDFSGIEDLEITSTTTVDFELVAFDPINNGADVRAWEIDEIKIIGCCTPQLGSIGSRVWRDKNGNGIQDEGEGGVPGVFIFLADEFGVELENVPFEYTGADGAYEFSNLPLGKYVVRFATPSGFILTGQDASVGGGNNDEKDSDASYLDGKTGVIMLTAGTPNVTNIDAGYYLAIDLPVDLERFYAEKNSCFTDLKWIATAEENFSHYEIQWGSSRSDFKIIGSVNTEGGRGQQYYFFTHENTSESNYYRLKMVDMDGSFEYSDVVNIDHDCNEAYGMSVYPNPVKKWDAEISVKFFQEEGQAQLFIIDGMGKVVRTFAPALAEFEWNLLDLDVSDLPSGAYYIMIDGNRQAGKFILTE